MFIGEIDYSGLKLQFWLTYIIFILFLFLIVIVLMNILNGLAVSDIAKIREDLNMDNTISKAERLAYSGSVSLQAIEITFFPNQGTENRKFCGKSIPWTRVSMF